MSNLPDSQSTSTAIGRFGRKSVTIVAPSDIRDSKTRNKGVPSTLDVSSASSENLKQPHRKVSFSDVVVTSRQVSSEDITENTADPSGVPVFTSSLGLHEQVTMVDMSAEVPNEESGHPIAVRLVTDPLQDDVTQGYPALGSSNLPIYVVRLGMLKQATLYQIEFAFPDHLPAGTVELLRFTEEVPGQVGVPVNVGATVELVSCSAAPAPSHGHNLVLRLATTKQTEIHEVFVLRLADNPSDAVYMILHGLSMRRGQGTPFLRIGIHRISENAEYSDSDEFTEWPGFLNLNDEDGDMAVDAPAVPSSAIQQLQGGCDAVGQQDSSSRLLLLATPSASQDNSEAKSPAQGDKVPEESGMDQI